MHRYWDKNSDGSKAGGLSCIGQMTFSTWLIGNIIVTILIVPLALRFYTKKVNKSKLLVKHYWD